MRITRSSNGSMCISENGSHELITCEGFDVENITKYDENGNSFYLFDFTKNECKVTANPLYNEWFENDKLFEVKMSYDNQLAMLELFPEIGIYRKENNITIYRKDNFTYFYVNYILDQHRALLNNFGAEINEK